MSRLFRSALLLGAVAFCGATSPTFAREKQRIDRGDPTADTTKREVQPTPRNPEPAPDPKPQPPAPKPKPKPKPKPRPEPRPEPVPPPTPPPQRQQGQVTTAEYRHRSVWPGEIRLLQGGVRRFTKLSSDEDDDDDDNETEAGDTVDRQFIGLGIGGNWNRYRWFGWGLMFDIDFWGERILADPIKERLATRSFGFGTQLWFLIWRFRPLIMPGFGWIETGKKILPKPSDDPEQPADKTAESEKKTDIFFTTVRWDLGFRYCEGGWACEIHVFAQRYFLERQSEAVTGFDRNVMAYGIAWGFMSAWDSNVHGTKENSVTVK